MNLVGSLTLKAIWSANGRKSQNCPKPHLVVLQRPLRPYAIFSL